MLKGHLLNPDLKTIRNKRTKSLFDCTQETVTQI